MEMPRLRKDPSTCPAFAVTVPGWAGQVRVCGKPTTGEPVDEYTTWTYLYTLQLR